MRWLWRAEGPLMFNVGGLGIQAGGVLGEKIKAPWSATLPRRQACGRLQTAQSVKIQRKKECPFQHAQVPAQQTGTTKVSAPLWSAL